MNINQYYLLLSSPPSLGFAKIVGMIVGEYEQKAAYKRYNEVGIFCLHTLG